VRHHARRDGTAFSSRTAIGGGLPIKVILARKGFSPPAPGTGENPKFCTPAWTVRAETRTHIFMYH
jgi:hypothetical protein